MGLNGQGKTIYLDRYIDTVDNSRIVTNVKPIIGLGERRLSKQRLAIISDRHNRDSLFDGSNINVYNNYICIESSDNEFSKTYIEFMNLICKEGDILVLDEPDMGLDIQETYKIRAVLILLNSTYSIIKIAMQSQDMLGMEDYIDVQYHWVKDYNIYKVSEEQIYGAIGTI